MHYNILCIRTGEKNRGLTNNRSYPYPFSPVPHYVCYNAIMRKKELALEVIRRLKEEYPYTDCTLDYDEAWKLLVSVRLAAQCTDERVNVIVEKLYDCLLYTSPSPRDPKKSSMTSSA